MIDLAWLKRNLRYCTDSIYDSHKGECYLTESDANEMMTEILDLREELFRAQYPQSEGLGPQHQE